MPPAKRARKAKPAAAPAVPPDPWERQPGEDARAFQAFAKYRDMGADRSTAKVARELSKAKQLMDRWSGAHGWQARVAAWDAELDRVAQAELVQERIGAAKRHARTAQAQIQIAAMLAGSVLEEAAKNPQLLERMTFKDRMALAVQWARAVPRVAVTERLALGMSSENVAGHDGGPLDPRREAVRRMSDNERTTYLLGELGEDVIDLGAERERRAAGAGQEE